MTPTTSQSMFGTVSESSDVVVAKERLWETDDGSELVPDGDPRAARLFCIPGQRITASEAERHGLTGKKQAKPEAEKQQEPPAAKQRQPEGDK